MKTKFFRPVLLAIATGGWACVTGCVIEPDRGVVAVGFRPYMEVAPRPAVYVAPPPEVYVGPVMVPDYYAWDGYEYVGYVGDQYYYLGPGNVWLYCEPFRVERFHHWEGGHGDWRNHATRNDHYRTDRNGHVQPRRDGPGKSKRDER